MPHIVTATEFSKYFIYFTCILHVEYFKTHLANTFLENIVNDRVYHERRPLAKRRLVLKQSKSFATNEKFCRLIQNNERIINVHISNYIPKPFIS